MRKAILALADGTVFEGQRLRRRRRGLRRGGLQHLDDRVPGDPHRPLLRRADGLHDLPGAGELRRRTAADEESAGPHATGFIVRHFAEEPSSFRAEEGLDAYLKRARGRGHPRHRHPPPHPPHAHHGRADGGHRHRAAAPPALVERARALPGMEGQDLATRISTPEPLRVERGRRRRLDRRRSARRRRAPALPRGGLRLGAEAGHAAAARRGGLPDHRGAEPDHAPPRRWRSRPDGVFLTNGPGDPAAVVGARETVAALLGKVPVFGICLGHQILALAIGARPTSSSSATAAPTSRCKDLATGKVDITAQNHGFAVDDAVAGQAGPGHPRQPERRHGRGHRGARRAGLQRPVPPGVVARARTTPAHLFGRFVGMMERRR